MKTTVYILYSADLKRYYTGMSSHPDQRLKQHLRGKSDWSSRANDWKRVFLQVCPDTSSARALGKRIKARGAARFIARKANI